MLILIGVGIAVGLFACGLAALLLGLGVISYSFIVGFRSGRPAAGIRTFFILCGIFAGIPAGAVCAWLARSLYMISGDSGDWLIPLYGAIGGALAGLLTGLALDLMSRRIHTWAVARLPSQGSGIRPGIE